MLSFYVHAMRRRRPAGCMRSSAARAAPARATTGKTGPRAASAAGRRQCEFVVLDISFRAITFGSYGAFGKSALAQTLS